MRNSQHVIWETADFSTAMSCPDASGHFVSSIKIFRKCKSMSWRPLYSSSKSVFNALLTGSLGSWNLNLQRKKALLSVARWPWGWSLHTILGLGTDQMHWCFSFTWWGQIHLPIVETLEQNTAAKLELCRPFLMSLKPVSSFWGLELGQ